MIRVEGLSAFYETENGRNIVLENIDLSVARESTCAIIGPSGCGKSTFLKILAGLVKSYKGNVRVAGAAVDPARLSIGFIPQSYGLLPWRTVGENIRLSRKVKHPKESIPRSEEKRLLARLGLGQELLTRYPDEISGGQQQRASLARAFLLRPDLLLMDEPFSALDAITREEMQEVFFELWREQGVTTVLVTHYMEEALYLGQTIVVLSSVPGRVKAVIDNPFFARREASEALAAQVERLRSCLRGGEVTS